ncbi:ALDH [Fusarium sp. NRRL 52700]|nr:ALDH [Fusarium sp. NRRL 52700]
MRHRVGDDRSQSDTSPAARTSHEVLVPDPYSDWNTWEFQDLKQAVRWSGRFITIYNPKDGALVSDAVALAGKADVDAAVEAAEAFFPAWRKTLPDIRRGILLNLAASLLEHLQAMAAMTRVTLGGPISVTGRMEAGFAVEALRYFSGFTDKLSGETYSEENGFFKLVRQEGLWSSGGDQPVRDGR